MNILIFPNRCVELTIKLYSIFGEDKRVHKIVEIKKLGELYSCLSSQSTSETICILILNNREEILPLVERKVLFWRMKTIIILNTTDKNCLSLIHQLHPRYFSYKSDGYGIIPTVCHRLLLTK